MICQCMHGCVIMQMCVKNGLDVRLHIFKFSMMHHLPYLYPYLVTCKSLALVNQTHRTAQKKQKQQRNASNKKDNIKNILQNKSLLSTHINAFEDSI